MRKRTTFILAFTTSISLSATVGDPCSANSNCAQAEICVVDLEGGYCVKYDCSRSNPCDAGSQCMLIQPEDFTLCLKSCSKKSDCRTGYKCYEEGVCLPEA